MKILQINNSLATFQIPHVKLIFSDPYNNTLGENNWLVIGLVLILCILVIFGTFLKKTIRSFNENSLKKNQTNVISNVILKNGALSLLPQM